MSCLLPDSDFRFVPASANEGGHLSAIPLPPPSSSPLKTMDYFSQFATFIAVSGKGRVGFCPTTYISKSCIFFVKAFFFLFTFNPSSPIRPLFERPPIFRPCGISHRATRFHLVPGCSSSLHPTLNFNVAIAGSGPVGFPT